jgi:hypothetical protein
LPRPVHGRSIEERYPVNVPGKSKDGRGTLVWSDFFSSSFSILGVGRFQVICSLIGS